MSDNVNAASLTYRPDIDGLRALAVWAVVIYHFFPSVLPGGFLGVDIFFVISGFLITALIVRQQELKVFSLKDFYARRIKRIFPALLVVLSVCLLAGLFLLWPDEYKSLGKHVFAGALFFSNIVSWREVGYFDPAGIQKPLLHLWSLSVEEQFYLIWPLLLLLKSKKGRGYFLFKVTGLALASLLLTKYLSSSDGTARFYMPFTRIWEFMAGAVLIAVPNTQMSKVVSRYANYISSLALVTMIVILRFGSNQHFNLSVAAVVLCTALLILSQGGWVNWRVLSNRVFVWFGLISYNFYLWHYMVLSFYAINLVGGNSRLLRLILLLASLALSILTYLFIEKPLRFSRIRYIPRNLLVGMAAVLAIALVVNRLGGIESRFTGSTTYAVKKSIMWQGEDTSSPACLHRYSMAEKNFCVEFGGSKPKVMLLGDSHANHFSYGLAQYFERHSQALTQLGEPGCLPFFGLSPYQFEKVDASLGQCPKREKYMQEALGNSNVDTIILAGRGPSYIEGNDFDKTLQPKVAYLRRNDSTSQNNATVYEYSLLHTIDLFLKAKKRVIFIIDNPELDFEPKDCLNLRPLQLFKPDQYPCALSKKRYDERNVQYLSIVRRVAKRFPQVNIFDAAASFCDARWCWAMKDGAMLYRDNDHLSKAGRLYVARAFASFMTYAAARHSSAPHPR
ncbi:acyltransferase family protein [Deinococcus sp.]|uniref:acyltransferase family protein n=1 Tax=Deinococcus sp. TaxID=47478 RepID=UPI003CC619B4